MPRKTIRTLVSAQSYNCKTESKTKQVPFKDDDDENARNLFHLRERRRRENYPKKKKFEKKREKRREATRKLLNYTNALP